MKRILLIIGLLWGGGTLGLWYWNDQRTQRVSFRTVAIKRGDLHSTINATGTIEPEEVVDVGAQVAGLIQGFGEDPNQPGKPISYGSRVEQGTVLARLDSAVSRPAWPRLVATSRRPRPTSSRHRRSSAKPRASWNGPRS